MRVASERVIYDNYDLWNKYPDDELKEMAIDCGWINEDEIDEISDYRMTDWRYALDADDWDIVKEELTKFFENKKVGFFGEVGRWNGVYKAGKIGEFWDLFDTAITDCHYIRLYDENGHLYLTCSHHDGTCHFEIKEITEKGSEYLENWEYDWNDNRSEQYVHNQIFKRYSHVPNYAHKCYGAKVREYKPMDKASIIDKLNNQARSFYC